MDDGKPEDSVCSAESIGGTDVWSCEDSQSSLADHLVVMVNGILGSNTDWKFAAEQFVKILPDKVIVHCSEKNVSMQTLDGIDVMGERLVEEVREVVKQQPHIWKISFIAHSLGGLVARYAIGKLYSLPGEANLKGISGSAGEENSKGTICGLEAMNFITVATPHLGSRGNKQVPFLFGVSAFEKAATHFVHWIFGRTGRHLYLTDAEDGKPPLLRRMVEDYNGDCFMSALRAFKRRAAYSNVGYDHIVGWRTSSIRRNNELPELDYSLSEAYPHVVNEEHSEAAPLSENKSISDETDIFDKLEEEMLHGLSGVSWEKVDVSFHSCKQRFAAHSVIQVKDEIVHSEGADVVSHIIDHFAV